MSIGNIKRILLLGFVIASCDEPTVNALLNLNPPDIEPVPRPIPVRL